MRFCIPQKDQNIAMLGYSRKHTPSLIIITFKYAPPNTFSIVLERSFWQFEQWSSKRGRKRIEEAVINLSSHLNGSPTSPMVTGPSHCFDREACVWGSWIYSRCLQGGLCPRPADVPSVLNSVQGTLIWRGGRSNYSIWAIALGRNQISQGLHICVLG